MVPWTGQSVLINEGVSEGHGLLAVEKRIKNWTTIGPYAPIYHLILFCTPVSWEQRETSYNNLLLQ
jgi:hypothetical protein